MIARAQAEGLCGPRNAPRDYVLDHNIAKFCALYGIDSKKVEDRTIASELPKGEGILIGCWNYGGGGQAHCVRFCNYVSAEKFRVMNPAPLNEADTFPEVEIGQLEKWKCDLFRIRLIDSAKPEK